MRNAIYEIASCLLEAAAILLGGFLIFFVGSLAVTALLSMPRWGSAAAMFAATVTLVAIWRASR